MDTKNETTYNNYESDIITTDIGNLQEQIKQKINKPLKQIVGKSNKLFRSCKHNF